MKDQKLAVMQVGGKVLANILHELKMRTTAGVQTKEIDYWARRLCLKHNVKPSFLDYEGFPSSICVSINDEVVHGIPGNRILKDGDIVSLDFGVYYQGFHTDSAISFGIGKLPPQVEKLLTVTKESLTLAIQQAVPGNHIGDIGYTVQSHVERNGFSVIRSLVGHGVGTDIHEEPLIPNYGNKGTGRAITKGMTLAIEPMVAMGGYEIYQDDDGWTYKTVDGSLVAHFEHSIYVDDNPIILTKGLKTE